MSSLQIYLARNNVQAGPYTLEQINTMLASNEVLPDDLAWHEGMDGWKKISELTQGKGFYNPNNTSQKNKPTIVVIDATKGGMTQNHELTNKEPERKNKITVDQLYGRKPTSDSKKTGKVTDKESNQPDPKVIGIQLPVQDLAGNQLATVASRIGAIAIDQVITALAIIPLFMNADPKSLDIEKAGSTFNLLRTLIENAPTHIATMVMLLVSALLIVQTVLLITKGQTLGKLIMAVRILDIKSHKIPSITNLILTRTILVQVIYSLPFIGMIFLIADLFSMISSPTKRSLHDKLAKTYVAKAAAEQLVKQKIEEFDIK